MKNIYHFLQGAKTSVSERAAGRVQQRCAGGIIARVWGCDGKQVPACSLGHPLLVHPLLVQFLCNSATDLHRGNGTKGMQP